MESILIYGIPAVALVVGLVSAIRKVGLPVKWLPLASLGLGILAGVGIYPSDIKQGVVVGIAIGLGASGLYDVGKKSTEE